MIAQIRGATWREKPTIFGPLVCVVESGIWYFYYSWRDEITDKNHSTIASRATSYKEGLYTLPDGQTLSVQRRLGGLYLDSEKLIEQWPTPYQRLLVSGARIFKVKPEDDTLLFEYKGDCPPLDMALAGFHIYIDMRSSSDA